MYKKLKELREEKGYTQEDMAKLLGYQYKSGYNQLEKGKRKIDLEQAKKIADIFGKTIEEIFFSNDVANMCTKYGGLKNEIPNSLSAISKRKVTP